MAHSRYKDLGIFLNSFADEVEVFCPKCQKPGKVLAAWKPYHWSGRFCCIHCSFVAEIEQGHWFGPVVLIGRIPCGYCGHQWLIVNERYASMSSCSSLSLPKACPECKKSSQVPVKALRDYADHAIDPHLGLPLRLKKQTRLGTIWVYNGRHLLELRKYISASLREGVTTNRSMFSRLPAWMKSGKNRDMVLHAIDQLQSEFLR